MRPLRCEPYKCGLGATAEATLGTEVHRLAGPAEAARAERDDVVAESGAAR